MIKQFHSVDVPICLYLQETGGDDQTAIQSKIQVLESKLAEALEENKLYRAQQKRYTLHFKLKCVLCDVHYTQNDRIGVNSYSVLFCYD